MTSEDLKNFGLDKVGLHESDFSPKGNDKDRIEELEETLAEQKKQNEMLTECLMELADIIYA